jgi:4'-phosphopantetheinyl transferase
MSISATSWPYPPPSFSLSADEVHVWLVNLDQPFLRVHQLMELLSEPERRRARRYCFERHRRRFVVARAVLRTIISYYTGLDPSNVEFLHGPQGKPCLPDRLGAGNLRFNLAHSNEVALYAFARGREIGIDVEHMRPVLDMEQITRRFFSTREYEELRHLPPELKQEAFFNCWTRKEAYLKARGEGLAQPLDAVEVSSTPGQPPYLLRVQTDPEEVLRWSLKALNPAPGYVAALAVEGHAWSLKSWRFQFRQAHQPACERLSYDGP